MTTIYFSRRAEGVEQMDRSDNSQEGLYETPAPSQLVTRVFSRYRSRLTRSVLPRHGDEWLALLLADKTRVLTAVLSLTANSDAPSTNVDNLLAWYLGVQVICYIFQNALALLLVGGIVAHFGYNQIKATTSFA